MIDKIINILKASDADGYEINDKVTLAYEFYFIGHKLDQNRVRDVEHINVTVYKKLDGGKLLGSASGEIYVTLTEDEIKKEVENLISRAENVKNPYYELNSPSEAANPEQKNIDVSEIAKNFVLAMQEIPETDTEYINSYEIFAESNRERIINSKGVDITLEYPSSMVEVVVNAKDNDHEIELYRMYEAGNCDKETLRKDITEVLGYGKDKLVAKPTPKIGKTAVVFSTQDAVSLYSYFAQRCNAAFIYNKYSDWEIGKEIAENVKGDKITLKGLKKLPNSSKNFDFDKEGAPISDITLMENNVPRSFWGARKFRYYLGIEDASQLYNFEAEGGSKDESEIRSGRFLEIVEFSDFSVDAISGDIAGEIRLGYYHDNGRVTPVAGGSISGCMLDFTKEMYMSKERRQFDNCLIPALTRLENVSVTGIE